MPLLSLQSVTEVGGSPSSAQNLHQGFLERKLQGGFHPLAGQGVRGGFFFTLVRPSLRMGPQFPKGPEVLTPAPGHLMHAGVEN